MSVLLQPDEANRINAAVMNEISPNLFIFCNYSPVPSEITNDNGGLFLLKLNNFYKLLVDSGWVIKKFAYIYSGREQIDSSSLTFAKRDIDKIYRILNELRTGFCHNVSSNNGDIFIINSITEWFNRHTLNNSIDYPKCVQHIDDDAKKVIDICGDFIDCVRKMPDADKKSAIERWKSVIIKHYVQKHDLFINMLGNYYISKNPQYYPKNLYDFKQHTVNDIILSYFTYDFEQYRNKIEDLPSKDPKILKPILEFIEGTKTERAFNLFKIKDSSLLYPKSDEEKGKLIDLFFEKELENVINDTLKCVPDCSLLPQHIFNEIIEKTATRFETFKLPFKRFDV